MAWRPVSRLETGQSGLGKNETGGWQTGSDSLIMFQSGEELLCVGVVVVDDFFPRLQRLARLGRLDMCKPIFQKLELDQYWCN